MPRAVREGRSLVRRTQRRAALLALVSGAVVFVAGAALRPATGDGDRPPATTSTTASTTTSSPTTVTSAPTTTTSSATSTSSSTTTLPDTTPPVIESFEIRFPELWNGSDCGETSTPVSAIVGDDAGVSSVMVGWSSPLDAGSQEMAAGGDGTYTSVIGPFAVIGESTDVDIEITALDTSANATSSRTTLKVWQCVA